MSRLKNKIKAALAKEGYTLTDLATRMDIRHYQLSNYLRGSGMRMDTALKISDSLADMTGYHLTLNDFRKDEA
jgi:transcriptional regulator with XRE-family HTH domain